MFNTARNLLLSALMAMAPASCKRAEQARCRKRLEALSADDGQVPDEALPTQPRGREFYFLWSYLR